MNVYMSIIKKKIILLIAIIGLSVLSSCGFLINDHGEIIDYKKILFINDSQHPIMVAGWFDENPDSLINFKLVFGLQPNLLDKINPNETYLRNAIPLTMENQFYYSFIILREESMDKYSREELIENKIYDYWYVFSYEDLKEMNFEVHFTGGDELDRFRKD